MGFCWHTWGEPKAILHPVTFGWHLRFLLNKKLLKIISKSSVHKIVIKKARELGIKYEILSYLCAM